MSVRARRTATATRAARPSVEPASSPPAESDALTAVCLRRFNAAGGLPKPVSHYTHARVSCGHQWIALISRNRKLSLFSVVLDRFISFKESDVVRSVSLVYCVVLLVCLCLWRVKLK